MVALVKGDVVVVPFPFTDLTRAKRRPALVVAVLPGDDVVLCQITSRAVRDASAIRIDERDFETGSLRVASNVRPGRLFTADHRLVLYRVGRLRQEKLAEVVRAVHGILQA